MGDPIEFHNNEGQQLLSHLQSIRKEREYSTEVWSDENLEIAVFGANEYKKLLDAVPPETSDKFSHDPGIQNCFLGSVPVQLFDSQLSVNEVDQINQAFLLRGQKFVIVSYRSSWVRYNVLVNIKSATKTIEKNKDIFDGVTDSFTFLKDHPEKYLISAALIPVKIHDQRHGVLAGYRRETVDIWSSMKSAFNIKSLLGGPKGFSIGDIERDGISYIGYSESDRIWFNEIIALRAESGISQIERSPDFK